MRVSVSEGPGQGQCLTLTLHKGSALARNKHIESLITSVHSIVRSWAITWGAVRVLILFCYHYYYYYYILYTIVLL